MIPPLTFRTGGLLLRSAPTASDLAGRGPQEGRLCAALAVGSVSLPLRYRAPAARRATASIVGSRLMACFFLLSLADLLLTGWLLGEEGTFFEANPLAAWCLDRFGWWGLAGLKALSFLLAAGGLSVLARRRPRLARGTLALGCLAVALVVYHGATLATAAPHLRQQYRRAQAALTRAESQTRRFDDAAATRRMYHERLSGLSRDILSGRRTLEAAVSDLEGLGFPSRLGWNKLPQRMFGGKTSRQILEDQLLGQLLADIKEGIPEGRRFLACVGWTSRRDRRNPSTRDGISDTGVNPSAGLR